MQTVQEILQPVTLPKTNGRKDHLITVAEYDRMIAAGVYTENDAIELLNGRIIETMPKGAKHAIINDNVARFFIKNFDEQTVVRNQNPIILDDFSEPEPDIVLAKLPREIYYESHPKPEDIYLVLEISDTTLVFDREEKAFSYSRAGIEQYLLINVQNQTIEDYREPSPDGYQFKKTHRLSDSFNLVAFPEIEIAVADILK